MVVGGFDWFLVGSLSLQWFVNKFPVWPPHPPILPKPNMNKNYYNHHHYHHHRHLVNVIINIITITSVLGQHFNPSLKMTSEDIKHGKLF